MRKPAKLLVVATMLLGACSEQESGESVTEKQCQEVQAHRANLRLKVASAKSGLSEAELAEHQKNFARMSEEAVRECATERSKAWAKCMLGAKSVAETTECE